MTFEEAKKSIRWILTVSHPIGSWELENIMDALDITPCDISTCKVAKALWGNKGNIPDIDISRVKNGTPLEAQRWIPKNATNGDMIISLYPNLKYYVKGDRMMTTIEVASSFDLEWWNAPYREGDNDAEC